MRPESRHAPLGIELSIDRRGGIRSARDNASILSHALGRSYDNRFWMIAVDDFYRFADASGLTIEALDGTYLCSPSPLDPWAQSEYFGGIIGVLVWLSQRPRT